MKRQCTFDNPVSKKRECYVNGALEKAWPFSAMTMNVPKAVQIAFAAQMPKPGQCTGDINAMPAALHSLVTVVR